jgi:hypothetical protein
LIQSDLKQFVVVVFFLFFLLCFTEDHWSLFWCPPKTCQQFLFYATLTKKRELASRISHQTSSVSFQSQWFQHQSWFIIISLRSSRQISNESSFTVGNHILHKVLSGAEVLLEVLIISLVCNEFYVVAYTQSAKKRIIKIPLINRREIFVSSLLTASQSVFCTAPQS